MALLADHRAHAGGWMELDGFSGRGPGRHSAADDPELALWPSSTGKVSRLNVFSVQSIKEAFDRPGCLLEKAGASET
ncbi:MAG: hypothetical protein AUG45_12460 [Ktedonobacter sp. 13_1_20CM_3_54_15]|nr:MAG: hypothetical protein AUH05_06705 [Ktedonobacter sp. 13_2_20CM_53_11]OLE31597.1 MAG: hypothetical protein AUG45_12460 [Ktedonobacter sp. 13_1_20CM_3_54_15]